MEEAPKNLKIFLDASVLVAATISETGGSFRIINEARLHGFDLVISRFAFREAERNVQEKYPFRLRYLYYLSSFCNFIPEPPDALIEILDDLIDPKDVPILAAAIHGCADMLLTLDKVHFLKNEKLGQLIPNLSILSPGSFIKKHFQL